MTDETHQPTATPGRHQIVLYSTSVSDCVDAACNVRLNYLQARKPRLTYEEMRAHFLETWEPTAQQAIGDASDELLQLTKYEAWARAHGPYDWEGPELFDMDELIQVDEYILNGYGVIDPTGVSYFDRNDEITLDEVWPEARA